MGLKINNIEFIDLPKSLRAYQLKGIDFLTKRKAALLADEMGLGKTVQVAVSLEFLFKNKLIYRVLIIVPASLKMNWVRELNKWAPSLSVNKISGGSKNRWASLHLPYNVVIASYDDIRIENENSNLKEKYDLVILDEAQRIKNQSSATSMACKLINRKASWALTGTPIENSLEDLISIFGFVKIGLLFEGLDINEVHNRIKKYFLRRKKKDVLQELPALIQQEIILELLTEQKNAYYEIIFNHNQNFKFTKDRIPLLLSLITKLKQICNYDPVSGASVKLDALNVIIDDICTSQKKILVFSQYVETLLWLSKRISNIEFSIYHGGLNEFEKEKILKKFIKFNGSYLLLISLKAGGLGLNLQIADTVVLFDRWWNPALENQAIDRAHRYGRNKPLHVIKFLVDDTIEKKIMEIITNKKKVFEKYIDEVAVISNDIFSNEIIRYLSKQIIEQ
jgi:SNF2 family DNA or RNA helicase